MQIEQRTAPNILSNLTLLPPILQRIYSTRGITDTAQLDKSLQGLLPFSNLSNIDKACMRIAEALRCNQRILIIGDFDADGATSTALAVTALKQMGAQQVSYLVPNRFKFGYGLTPDIVEVAKLHMPNLIITVDNGINSIDGVELANQSNIDVLITDHHLAGNVLPDAYAIINPNQDGDNFASKAIAGVGVIFYVMVALRRYLTTIDWFSKNNLPETNMAQFLDLVALGTIADVVPLDQNNRILVNQGLTRIRRGLSRPGIFALIKISGRNYSSLRESDLGFAIAPRLNAAGRLDDMSIGIECLLSNTIDYANNLAAKLDSLNQERRLIETEMKEQALTAIGNIIDKIETGQHLPVSICLMDKDWHQGVIGILAGRLKERYHRPTIVFAYINETELKGSARSISTINIRDILAAIDSSNPGLISRFGGHAMAAGLSIRPDTLPEFQSAFLNEIQHYLQPSQCCGKLLTDGPLSEDGFNIETALLLQAAGPWGQQFPEPCFDNIFELIDQRIVGGNHLKLMLTLPGSDVVLAGIAFNVDRKIWPNYRIKQAHIAYRLDINFYQGISRLQLMVET